MAEKKDDDIWTPIKLDDASVFGLCNSLNAWVYPIREVFPQAAKHLLRAEGMIFALHE